MVRLGALLAALVACLSLTSCAWSGTSIASRPGHLTAQQQRILQEARGRWRDFSVKLPGWLPSGWALTRYVPHMWALKSYVTAILVLRGHGRRILLDESFNSPGFTRPAAQGTGRQIRERAPDQVSVYDPVSRYTYIVRGMGAGVPLPLLRHIARSLP